MILLNCSSFGIAHLFRKCWLHGSSFSEKAEDRNVVQCHTSEKRVYSEAAALRGWAFTVSEDFQNVSSMNFY